MVDETLIDVDLRSIGPQLIEPFDEARVQPASYDLAVGGVVFIVFPEHLGGIRALALDALPGGAVEIPPGHRAIVRSLEIVRLPADTKGRLSLRAFHATKLVFFAGGVIDPGYNGFLFLPIANLSDAPLRLEYGEPIVSAEFVRLGKSAEPYQGGEEVMKLPDDRLPLIPSRETLDTITLNDRLDELARSVENLTNTVDRLQPSLASAQTILNVILLGAVAAVLAGLTVVAFTSIPDPQNWYTVVSVLGFATLVEVIYRIRRI